MTDTVLTYKGRPVTDLTKNELVDAMTWAFQEIEYQRERADRLLNAAALVEPEPEGPTPSAELLPAAQAVLNAFRADWKDEHLKQDVKCLAAALRTLADTKASEVSVEGHYRMIVDVDDIHAIADELEAQ